MVRANGQKTYFASDIAYHRNKFRRGFDRTINIWGADHHGYVPRVKAVVEMLGHSPSSLVVLLVQLVNLLRGGKAVAMSTRAGEFVTLKEVMEEVGVDAARYIFLTRRSDTPLDFDLEIAKKQSDETGLLYPVRPLRDWPAFNGRPRNRTLRFRPSARSGLNGWSLRRKSADASARLYPDLIEKARSLWSRIA